MKAKQVTRRQYGQSTVDEICRRLRSGESLLRISRDPEMPSQRTLSDWVAKNHLGFAERYLEAKRIAAHFLAEQLMEEARNDTNDFFVDENGAKRPNGCKPGALPTELTVHVEDPAGRCLAFVCCENCIVKERQRTEVCEAVLAVACEVLRLRAVARVVSTDPSPCTLSEFPHRRARERRRPEVYHPGPSPLFRSGHQSESGRLRAAEQVAQALHTVEQRCAPDDGEHREPRTAGVGSCDGIAPRPSTHHGSAG